MTTQTVQTPTLTIAYEQSGPADGEPVLLLHGWPYDVRSYDRLRPLLADAGRRVIVPYLRGFGPTAYRSAAAFRSGQQAAVAQDVVDLMDALCLGRATLVGYDWGGRAACGVAAVWPERVRGLVSCGGYTIENSSALAADPGDVATLHAGWYRWLFNASFGAHVLSEKRAAIARECWQAWSPLWRFSDAEFAAAAKSFDNPDWVATTIHSYRFRYDNAGGDPALADLETRLQRRPKITVPTIVLHGEIDGVVFVQTSADHAKQFTGSYERRMLPNVGHCPPAEEPMAVIQAVEDLVQRTP